MLIHKHIKLLHCLCDIHTHTSFFTACVKDTQKQTHICMCSCHCVCAVSAICSWLNLGMRILWIYTCVCTHTHTRTHTNIYIICFFTARVKYTQIHTHISVHKCSRRWACPVSASCSWVNLGMRTLQRQTASCTLPLCMRLERPQTLIPTRSRKPTVLKGQLYYEASLKLYARWTVGSVKGPP